MACHGELQTEPGHGSRWNEGNGAISISGARRHPTPGEVGQSLLEVLISIVFMASILLMSLNFMVAGIRGNSRGREMSAASYLAQEMLEEMRMVNYDDLTDFDGYITGGALPGGEPARSMCEDWATNIVSEIPSGRGEIDVQLEGILTRITVTVFWVDGVNKERQVRYETLIAQRS